MKMAARFGEILKKRKLTVAVAESCTGGFICKMITDAPGSSDYFDRGFITYSNKSKMETLSVPSALISEHGAVSAECAESMARQLKKITGCDVCIATTGIAGPGGGTVEKPAGLVYAGFMVGDKSFVKKMFFTGSRGQIRKKTADYCLKFVIDELTGA